MSNQIAFEAWAKSAGYDFGPDAGQTELRLIRYAKAAWQAAIAHAVPEGYVVVPVEPTLELGWAYIDAANADDPKQKAVFNWAGYRAMIAATQGEAQGEKL